MARALLAIIAVLLLTSSEGLPPSHVQLFSTSSLIEAELDAPFHDLISNARNDPEYTVKGTLTYIAPDGRRLTIKNVSISTRGHTSLRESECEFPKLKLKFHSADGVAGSLFDGASSVKIGTHCGNSDDHLLPKFGRLANEKAPLREAFVYHLLDVVGIPSLKARPARISYTESGEPPLVRGAMFLEDEDEAVERYGASRQLTEETFGSARDHFSAADGARLAFGEAMIGNFDWCVRWFTGDKYRCDDRHPLWNVLAPVKGTTATPIMYDFDLSGLVVGQHIWFKQIFNPAIAPSASEAEVEVMSQLQHARSLFPRNDLDRTRMEFLRMKPRAYQALDNSDLDGQGREYAHTYLDAFFSIIGDESRFYSPVVVDPDARITLDAAGRMPACGTGEIPAGTPVGQPLATAGAMMRVVVLDALWHWAPPAKCEAVHSGSVWLRTAAVSTNYPPASGESSARKQ
jgi:hypothetical protein